MFSSSDFCASAVRDFSAFDEVPLKCRLPWMLIQSGHLGSNSPPFCVNSSGEESADKDGVEIFFS
jgi:hypothetical protein